MGIQPNWKALGHTTQVAWNEMAVCIRNSDHFFSDIEIPLPTCTHHNWVQSDGTIHCCHCGKIKGEVITETVDGGGIGVSAKLGKAGTG
jgi:hypothetical protein